jgi:hypothetical protein
MNGTRLNYQLCVKSCSWSLGNKVINNPLTEVWISPDSTPKNLKN